MVDAGRIKVTPEVAAASAYIRQRAVALDGELDVLRPQVAALKDTWTGDPGSPNAADHYQTYQLSWDSAAMDLWGKNGDAGLLPDIANRMNVVAGNYYETEVTNSRGWTHG
jgi:uncharacterized protein YukE